MAKRPKPPSLFDAPGDAGLAPPPPPGAEAVSLHEAAQTRYLNYALSVITSRALPDVRDGLKPVQRRILYTMWQQNLTADAKHRKCAKVVGDVMGNYHPHGDAALYETLVRMAQPFSLRYPLVDGSGNFGSLDGDSAAAMRYTECRLARISDEMLTEIDQDTVPFRPELRRHARRAGRPAGAHPEPADQRRDRHRGRHGDEHPAAQPHRGLHGAHQAARRRPRMSPASSSAATSRVRIFRPAARSSTRREEIEGDLQDRLAARSACARPGRKGPATRSGKTIYITSVPYTVNKSTLVERIADVALSRKLPPLVDVRDLSTDDVRIALELKKDADEKMVMAYLFKHTPLQTNFPVNLTCLMPTENPDVGKPGAARSAPDPLALPALPARGRHARAWSTSCEALKKRIHILEGFEKVFDALDEILKIVRKSEGKADAAEKIMKRFELDAEQTDAILELKIYRLARLEILVIQQELAEKRQAREGDRRRSSRARRTAGRSSRDEIEEIQKKYGDARRTEIVGEAHDEEYTAEDFIVEEDNVVIVSRDGWVKRQKEVKDIASTRVREGDAVLAVLPGSTRATVVFFTQLRRGVHRADRRRAGVDRVRRADSEPVQVEGRREGRAAR